MERVSVKAGLDVAHGGKMKNVAPNLDHRSDGIVFRYLFEGSDEPGPARRNNMILALVTTSDFYSPVHHHNFEQFRYAIKGEFSIGPQSVIAEGELGFTGEGVYYGPQKDGPGERTALLFQYGGSSGQGFLNWSTLRAANKALQTKGAFKEGKYYSAQDGNPIDGFQALWEHCNAPEKLVYPKPQYDKPLTIKPRNFSWVPISGKDGLFKKHLGTFSEREVRVQQWKIVPGAELIIDPRDAVQLLYVHCGKGTVDDEHVEAESAIRLSSGADARLVAVEELILLHWVIPTI